jgi:dTMP kinase
MKLPGFLISIEGIDGAGKSLLAQNLYKELLKQNKQVVLTKEPGGTPFGQSLREILHYSKEKICATAEFLIFAADRAQHLEQVLIPALKEGKIVISDRMGESSVAYQGYGRNLDVEMIQSINKWALQRLEPNLILYIQIDAQTALERVFKRNEVLTSFEKEKMDFWKKVTDGYEKILHNKTNVVILDGKLSPEEICKNAMEAIENARSLRNGLP